MQRSSWGRGPQSFHGGISDPVSGRQSGRREWQGRCHPSPAAHEAQAPDLGPAAGGRGISIRAPPSLSLLLSLPSPPALSSLLPDWIPGPQLGADPANTWASHWLVLRFLCIGLFPSPPALLRFTSILLFVLSVFPLYHSPSPPLTKLANLFPGAIPSA